MTHGAQSRLDQNAWHPFRNDSGETIPAYAVMKVTGVVEVNGRTLFTCAQPDSTFQRIYAVNAAGAIINGGYGECTFGPAVVVAYDTGTPAVTESWGAASGQWTLTTGRPGFTIIGLTATGTDLSVVEAIQEPVNVLTGKTDATGTVDSTVSISVHFQASPTASAYDITGHIKWMHNSENISSGKEVLVQWIDGQWLVTGAECE